MTVFWGFYFGVAVTTLRRVSKPLLGGSGATSIITPIRFPFRTFRLLLSRLLTNLLSPPTLQAMSAPDAAAARILLQ